MWFIDESELRLINLSLIRFTRVLNEYGYIKATHMSCETLMCLVYANVAIL